jgi:CspA family cold shock protein
MVGGPLATRADRAADGASTPPRPGERASEEVMAVGKVKWFNDEKGWGFIKQEVGPDVFVHYSQIHGEGRRRLLEEENVEFEIKEGPKGLQAVNVVRTQAEIAAVAN